MIMNPAGLVDMISRKYCIDMFAVNYSSYPLLRTLETVYYMFTKDPY